MFTNKKGFTLIEILIVIAIIGILSAAVLAGIGPARQKAKDSRIISGMKQIAVLVESQYNSSVANPYSQGVVDGNVGAAYNKQSTDINNAGGDLYYLESNGNGAKGYLAYSKLASDITKFFCVDSRGNALIVESEPDVSGDFDCKGNAW